MFCNYSGERTWKDECCMAWKDKSEDYNEPKTNADRIRSMSDEELARILAEGCHHTRECPTICSPIYPFEEVVESCEKCWLGWLKQEKQQ